MMDDDGAIVTPPTISPHAGNLVYHCRRCDTHVTMSVEELLGRDITKLCLCGHGVITRESSEPQTISPAWPVKPRVAMARDRVIDERIAKNKHPRTEWEEVV